MTGGIGEPHITRHIRSSLWLGLVFVLAGAAYATSARWSQLKTWERLPGLYVASGTPMMTTLDAYYSLRLARLQASGTFVPHGPAPARHYSRPEQGSPDEWYEQREPKFLPLLSRTISAASILTGGNIDKAALLLAPVLSSLFMIPLFLCCWRLGSPAAGVMGGLIAAFCIEYYRRTSVGWVDTDALNLFFPWMISYLVLMMSANLRRDRLLLLAAAAGAVLYVYYLWYPKPGLLLLFAAAMAAHLLVAGVPWRRCVACMVTLIVFANPAHFGNALPAIDEFMQRHLSVSPTQPAFAIPFASVWSTITEAQSIDPGSTLRLILDRTDLVIIGLAAFLPFALKRWRELPALTPVLLLAGLALVSSRRFAIYLAPFVGIGWGWIIGLLVRTLTSRISGDGHATSSASHRSSAGSHLARMACTLSAPTAHTAIACSSVIAVFLIWFAPVSGRSYVPPPAVPAPVFRDLQILADRLPSDARIWTWWDLGFAIVDTTGFGVYHDGAAQYTAQTNIIATSLIHPDQRVMHRLIGFIDHEGNRGIQRFASQATDLGSLVDKMVGEAPQTTGVPIYVLFTTDMLHKYPSLRYLAGPPGGKKTPAIKGLEGLTCESIADDQLHCGPRRADLRTGKLEGDWLDNYGARIGKLRRAIVVKDGFIVRARDYEKSVGPTLQIALAAGGIEAVYLLDESAYRSNLNQMFVLGRFDRSCFEEVYNGFPNTRVFRVIQPLTAVSSC